MKTRYASFTLLFALLIVAGCSTNPIPSNSNTGKPAATAAADPLPSWNDGATKKAIVDFVTATTEKSSPNFVSPEDRIATFDQDGTTWVEQPMYSQFLFVLDRINELAPQHPEWKTKMPYKAVLSGDKRGPCCNMERSCSRPVPRRLSCPAFWNWQDIGFPSKPVRTPSFTNFKGTPVGNCESVPGLLRSRKP